jgi:hypothetical protein
VNRVEAEHAPFHFPQTRPSEKSLWRCKQLALGENFQSWEMIARRVGLLAPQSQTNQAVSAETGWPSGCNEYGGEVARSLETHKT